MQQLADQYSDPQSASIGAILLTADCDFSFFFSLFAVFVWVAQMIAQRTDPKLRHKFDFGNVTKDY